mmetsp:Transcript_3911/g.13082  ORF Transcript_3911/g.13082 Transcript_3911/m.13082 type:complete len:232 (-) Transcript_3911:858-1553(-)
MFCSRSSTTRSCATSFTTDSAFLTDRPSPFFSRFATPPFAWLFRYTPYSSFALGMTTTLAHACFRNGSSSHSFCSSAAHLNMVGSCCFESSSSLRPASAYASGDAHLNANSSSSFLTWYIPNSLANGANTSKVSLAILTRFSGFKLSSVRMLCNRSASFTMITRTSCVIAKNISLKSSAWTFCVVGGVSSALPSTLPPTAPASFFFDTDDETLLTFVSPSTIRRTAGPNRS